jgi:hypothetical protein
VLGDLLDLCFGSVPDPLTSWEQAERYYHHDLRRWGTAELQDERERVHLRRLLEPRADTAEWLREREDAIGGELTRRRREPPHERR